jgi:1,4-dihydroxy-2-naphthoate octaprenyltransferase
LLSLDIAPKYLFLWQSLVNTCMGTFSVWIQASRPKTLVASLVPIYVALQLFLEKVSLDQKACILTFACLVFIISIQIATNLANDFYDAKSGADTNRKNAPERVVSSGKLRPIEVINVALGLLIISFCIGVFIVLYSDSSFLLFPLGVICILLALIYTGGPFPLAYNGLGDIFVILFFGMVAVEVTKYVLCSASNVDFSYDLDVSISVGLLLNNLLVINNYRDFETDKAVRKNTSIVLFGKKFGIFLFISGVFFPIFSGVLANNILVVLILPTSFLSLYMLITKGPLANSNKSLSLSALSAVLYGVFCVI